MAFQFTSRDVHSAARRPPSSTNTQDSEQDEGPGLRGSRRVLIVDDDPDMLSALVDLLELDADYLVDTAGGFDAAESSARAHGPAVALLDVKLGARNGIDLIPRLRSLDPSIVVIIMTAYRDLEYLENAVSCGADEFLYKPLDSSRLRRLIREALG